MKNIILAFILTVYGVGFAATGDIKSVTIDPTGWKAEIVIEGFSTSGTYALGIDTSHANNSANAKCLFVVTRKGFNAHAQTTTMLDTVVATVSLRKPYPDNATKWEDANGGNVRVRLALSEYIHSEDVVQCNLAAGWYTNAGGGSVNAVTGYTVTNSSTEAYITPVGNWSYPDRTLISNNILEPHCFVVHRSGRNGRPVACVIFTATDGASNTVRDTVLIPSISSTMPDAVPVCEYWTQMDVSALRDGDITLNFKAYPWVGEALLSSDDAAIGAVNSLLKDQIYYKSSSFGRAFAFVDVAGNNGTGVASADSAAAFAAPFADIGSAIDACESFNNTNYGRNNPDNSVIYLTAGVHEAEGTPIYVSNTNTKIWTEIKGYPAHKRGDIIIVADSDRWGTFTSKYTRLSHVTLRQEADTWVIADMSSSTLDIWLDKVSIAGYGSATGKWAVYAYPNIYVTHSVVDSSLNIDADIVRGNTVTNMKELSQATVIVGNTMSQRADGKYFVIDKVIDNAVIAYNTCYRLTYGWLSHASADINYGLAVVGNMVEQISDGAANAMITLGTKDISIRNLIMWNNSFVGQRYLGGYTTDNGLEEYTLTSHKNSIYYYFANKTDLFYHNTDGLGGWPIGFGVGCSGNAIRSQPYNQEFAGLSCKYGANTGDIFGFIDDQGTLGGNNGNGDYGMNGTGLGIALSKDLTMPLDIRGNPFRVKGAAGAYEYGGTTEIQSNEVQQTEQPTRVFSGENGWYDLQGSKVMPTKQGKPGVVGVYLHVQDGVAVKVMVVE